MLVRLIPLVQLKSSHVALKKPCPQTKYAQAKSLGEAATVWMDSIFTNHNNVLFEYKHYLIAPTDKRQRNNTEGGNWCVGDGVIGTAG